MLRTLDSFGEDKYSSHAGYSSGSGGGASYRL